MAQQADLLLCPLLPWQCWPCATRGFEMLLPLCPRCPLLLLLAYLCQRPYAGAMLP